MPEWVVVWAVPVTTALVAALGVALSVLQYRRANYERAERLLDYATTGDVATARHLLGSQAWIRADVSPGTSVQVVDPDHLIQALFRVAWAFDRIYAVRQTVRFRPRGLIDEVLGSWVHWWGADEGHGCRYGRTAAHLAALDSEEHDHLARLVATMGGRPCPDVNRHRVA